MAKQSAGLLVYKKSNQIEVLIVHPGGPFWAKKDKGAWSIPKGELDENEDGLSAAKREFSEEIGQEAPAGDYQELGSVKNKSGKTIYAWATEGSLDVTNIKSNTMQLEWRGEQHEFPEVDKAGWFGLDKAKTKLNPAQAELIDRLAAHLGEDLKDPPVQASLF